MATELKPALPNSALARTLDWNLLRTFLVIAESASISRAAQTLCRTQPAVSASLKRLEDQLGSQLLVRNASTFKLTEAGALLRQECEEVFNAIGHIPSLIAEDTKSFAGTFKLHMASHIVSDLIDDTLTAFHAEYPKLTINIVLMASSKLIESLQNRSINFAVSLASRQLPDLDYFHLYREYFGFFCGAKHPFFGRDDVEFSDLAGQNAVSFKVFALSDVLQTITGMYARANFVTPFAGLSDHLEEVRRLIKAGVGIGALPVHIAQRDVDDGLLWQLPPYTEPSPMDIYLVTNPKVQLSRAELAFIRTLRTVTGKQTKAQRTYLKSTRA